MAGQRSISFGRFRQPKLICFCGDYSLELWFFYSIRICQVLLGAVTKILLVNQRLRLSSHIRHKIISILIGVILKRVGSISVDWMVCDMAGHLY